jgi:salicylate hydroxylase
MGGLGCALSLAKKGFKDITVYENASNLGFVGAGIQLAPNMNRILDRLGCWQEIYAEATNVKETSIRRESMTSPDRIRKRKEQQNSIVTRAR